MPFSKLTKDELEQISDACKAFFLSISPPPRISGLSTTVLPVLTDEDYPHNPSREEEGDHSSQVSREWDEDSKKRKKNEEDEEDDQDDEGEGEDNGDDGSLYSSNSNDNSNDDEDDSELDK